MQIEGTTPLWIAARLLLYERGDDLFRRRDKVLKTYDAEDIHDLRVASRRLRESLVLFAPCYPPASIARLVRKVRRVTRLLGAIRNADEALLFFTALADEFDGSCRSDLEGLARSFQKNRRKALKKLRKGLREMAPAPLRDLYLRTINSLSLFNPPAGGADLFAPLSGFAREALDARLADVTKLVPAARHAEEIEAQHLLRIAVKHFRYRMEILAMLLGAHFKELHATVKGYQEVLGKMHDLDVFAGIVQKESFPSGTVKPVLDAIALKRANLFNEFTRMLETAPFEAFGARVRGAL
jgi:CHAD domain-containing protein